jgi:hypothetical protein
MSMEDVMEKVLDEYRKFIPQIAYVALAAFTLISDRVQDGRAIDGVTYVALAVAVVQALAVVLPSNPVVKTVASLVLALAQVLTSALTDNSISLAEGLLVAIGFLSWASSAAAVNRVTAARGLAGVVRPD